MYTGVVAAQTQEPKFGVNGMSCLFYLTYESGPYDLIRGGQVDVIHALKGTGRYLVLTMKGSGLPYPATDN